MAAPLGRLCACFLVQVVTILLALTPFAALDGKLTVMLYIVFHTIWVSFIGKITQNRVLTPRTTLSFYHQGCKICKRVLMMVRL